MERFTREPGLLRQDAKEIAGILENWVEGILRDGKPEQVASEGQ
jgi:hypothetical protein